MALSSNFINNSIVYTKEKDITNACCFGLFKEYDYLVSNDRLSNTFVMEKLGEANGEFNATSFISNHIDYIRKTNKSYGPLLVISQDFLDMTAFKEEMFNKRKSVFQKGLMEIATEQNNKEKEDSVEFFTYKYFEEPYKYGNSTYNFKATNPDNNKQISFLLLDGNGIRKEFNQTFNFDRFYEKNNLKKHDFLEGIFYHEMGHFFDNKNGDRAVPYNKHKAESFADIYSSLMMFKKHKNTNYIKALAYNRNNNFLKDFETIEALKSDKQYVESIAPYNTSYLLLNLAKNLDKNPEIVNKNHDDLLKFAFSFLDQSIKPEKEFNNLQEDVLNQIKSEKIKEFYKIQNDFFENNGYNFDENRQKWQEYVNNSSSKQQIDIKKERKKITKDFFENVSKNSKSLGYDEAFLSTFSKMHADAINLNDDTKDIKTVTLKQLLDIGKDGYKPQIAYDNYYEKIKTPDGFDNINGKNAINCYVGFKSAYLETIDKVIEAIDKKDISKESEMNFKKALMYAKYSNLMAQKSSEFLKENPTFEIDNKISKSIMVDTNFKQPPELHEIFLNQKPSEIYNKDNFKNVINRKRNSR
ncbi:MAG: hypothetical protein BWY78_00727 [Alphaproteobacteria bacterium ADurb.Bin438]|nr:MAG: hypothetical protein BWY78_00727 [Alphaproteobacteria bacterium ADurb.Bin438]